MKFRFLDTIIEKTPDRIVALKQVLPDDEYLADHFPTFPVLPGVLMVETMVQAARHLMGDDRLVLGEVKALKFGGMVRPGEGLRVEVSLLKPGKDGSFVFKGVGKVDRSEIEDDSEADRPSSGGGDSSGGEGNSGGGETAVAGRFIMRPLRHD